MERKNHISYRIFILTGIFFLICLLYVVRLAGIVLTEEAPEMQDHTYQYVTIKAARGQIYDRNGVPLVTNQYVQIWSLTIRIYPTQTQHATKSF